MFFFISCKTKTDTKHQILSVSLDRILCTMVWTLPKNCPYLGRSGFGVQEWPKCDHSKTSKLDLCFFLLFCMLSQLWFVLNTNVCWCVGRNRKWYPKWTLWCERFPDHLLQISEWNRCSVRRKQDKGRLHKFHWEEQANNFSCWRYY